MKEIHFKNNCLYITPTQQNTEIIINKIFNIVKNSNFSKFQINLSNFNMFETVKIVTMICTKGLILDITKQYEFIVENELIANHIKPFALSNFKISICEESLTNTMAN